MKTAKEMFKELGYEQTVCEQRIEYDQANGDELYPDWKCIVFYLTEKELQADENYDAMIINIPTFKAIIQQMKELGWLDE